MVNVNRSPWGRDASRPKEIVSLASVRRRGQQASRLRSLRSEGHAPKHLAGGRLLIGHELFSGGESGGGKGISDCHESCRVRLTARDGAVLARDGVDGDRSI